MDLFLKHVDAVKSFLLAVKSSSAYEDAVRQQEAVLVGKVNCLTIDISSATTVVNAFEGLPPLSVQRLTECLMLRVSTASQQGGNVDSRHRSGLQDWTHAPSYFSEKQWSVFFARDNSEAARLDLMLDHMCRLGLQHASEATVQVLTALYFCAIAEKSISPDPSMRLATARQIKAQLKRVAGNLQDFLPKFATATKLPASSVEFRLKHDAAFAEAEFPVACKVALVDLASATAVTPMRESRRDVRGSASKQVPTLDLQCSQPSNPQQQMLQLMQMMMTCMKPQSIIQPCEPQDRSRDRLIGKLQSRLALTNEHDVDSESSSASASLALPPDAPAVILPPPPAEAPALTAVAAPPAKEEKGSKKRKSVSDSTAAMVEAIRAKSAAKKAEEDKPPPASKTAANKKAGQQKETKTAAAKKKPPKETKTAAAKNKPPTIAWERSRFQVTCRTGEGGAGSAHAIKFTKGGDKAAWAKAEKWLKAERAKQGI
jgi:hypothetical protein